MPPPLQVDNIFLFIRQVAPNPACRLFKTSAEVDLLTLKVVSESRVAWATSANFSLPRPLRSRVRSGVRDRCQTNASLNASIRALWGGGIIMK